MNPGFIFDIYGENVFNINWFEPVLYWRTMRAFNQAEKKEVKAACIHEGRIHLYSSLLHPLNEYATLVQTPRDVSKQKTYSPI